MSSSVVHVPMETQIWKRKPDWVRLDSLCTGVFDCPHSTPKLTADGPLVVRSQDVRSGVFRWDEAAHVSDDTYVERIARAEPRFGDLLYSREGTYFGIAAEMPANKQVCLGQRMVLIRPDLDCVNYRFLRFWLNSPVLSRHIHGFRDGTVAERLNMPTIRGLPIPLLPRDEQDAIADLLGSLDDKIELNRQMNETLEAMAQAIFRDWFVDFGPTRRRLEGATDPVEIMGGLVQDAEWAQALADLLPAKLGDDGLPEGWRPGSASSLVEFNPKEPLKKGTLAPYSDMSSLPTVGSIAERPVQREYGSGMRFKNGDALLARITPCLENGKAAFVDFLPDQSAVGWGSTEFYVLRARQGVPAPFAYLLVRHPEFRAVAIASMTGTSGRQRAQVDRLEEFPFVVPPQEALTALGDFVLPMFDKISANGREDLTLAATRDFLLPKLMSGEIRLTEAEELMEAAQ